MRLWGRTRALVRFVRSALLLRGAERRFFLTAWWTLLLSQGAVRLRPPWSGRLLPGAWDRESVGPWNGDLAEPRLLELFERAAGDHVLGITCLGRSLALKRLLDRRHIGSRLRIGARRNAGRLEMHAWIEREGRALTGGNEGPFLPLEKGGLDG